MIGFSGHKKKFLKVAKWPLCPAASAQPSERGGWRGRNYVQEVVEVFDLEFLPDPANKICLEGIFFRVGGGIIRIPT